ncbi:MAG: NUDIX hydrolase, partial [Clostridia bacterium]|nr:NUDIX hydrolase [Clostridia bacterium]
MPEYWDILDEQRQLMNKLHKRGTPLKRGEFHLVVDIVVINTDGRVLIDRRSPKKRNCPNYWEFTSGSVLAGEQ